jgi:hypothetical protein
MGVVMALKVRVRQPTLAGLTRNEILDCLALFDCAEEHSEKTGVGLVDERDGISLVLVDQLQQRRDVQLRLEGQMILDWDRHFVDLPQPLRLAGEEHYALALRLVAVQPLRASRAGLSSPSRVFLTKSSNTILDERRNWLWVEVQIHAQRARLLYRMTRAAQPVRRLPSGAPRGAS